MGRVQIGLVYISEYVITLFIVTEYIPRRYRDTWRYAAGYP